jgi:hypothetical protein
MRSVSRRRALRRFSISLVSAGLAVGLGLGAVPASGGQAKTNYAPRAAMAASWQGSQLVHGHIPGFAPGYPDWGLTVDTAFMLSADGSHPDLLTQVDNAISKHITDYVVYKKSWSSGAL